MNPDHDTDSDRADSDADQTDGDSEQTADEPRTLTVRVGSAERTRSEALERVRAVERGEDVDERHVLNVEDESDLARLVSETNLELLRAIADHEPRSMRHVEEIVERDHKEVHRNLTELDELGVVEFVQDGRAKRPRVRFDRLEITIPLRRDSERDVVGTATDEPTRQEPPADEDVDSVSGDSHSEP